MPRRLWHRLLIGNIVLIVAVLAGLAIWQAYSFERGFSAYLDTIAVEQAEAAARRLEQAYDSEGSWTFLQRDDGRFGALVGGRDGTERPQQPRHASESISPRSTAPMSNLDAPINRPPRDERDRFGEPPPRPTPEMATPGAAGRPDQPVGPTPWTRLRLLDADRQQVAGLPPQHEVLVELALTHQGQIVGYLQVPRVRTLSLGPEQTFSKLQTHGLLVALLVSVLIAVGVSVWLARNLTRPLRALQAGIEQFQTDALPVRLPIDRRDELGTLAQRFNAMTQALHDMQQERERWTRDIAHELRTPVAILQAEIQAMVDGIRPATPEQLLQLQSECRRLSRLAEDLSLLDLHQGQGFACEPEEIDFATIVQAGVNRFRNRLLAQGLNVSCTPLPSAPLYGDPERLGQVLDNVLENALRYTDPPGEVRIGMACDADHVVLSIEDSAPSVPDAALPHLFDRLYRVEASRGRSLAGSGLGLSIAASIVAAHDGQISALHSPLGGLHIRVQLPLNRVSS
ncbi:hypothetical protein C7S18_08865 [Ahniella affigens]|uniref:histidine kinase n=1 Tax=Ahniella affigens TaxID=2021234 RepID=A0A2P1PR36_9GAMM|nr:ATP-binding protein [Ahniella affigens]AVP97295.1 hypothetical protein C7S18_08865 [Ahniella affigens]